MKKSLIVITSFIVLSVVSSADCIEGNCEEPGYTGDTNVLTGDIVWQNRVDSPTYDNTMPDQYGDTCGDDPNEYLIREHGDSGVHDPNLSEESVYGCAVSPKTCYYNEQFYSIGERVDVSTEEEPINSPDFEVCADLNTNAPGAELIDPDNPELNQYLKGSGTYISPEFPVTLQGVMEEEKSYWITKENSEAFKRAYNSPYSNYQYEGGYALEYNVYGLSHYDTSKKILTSVKDNAVYSFFQHGRKLDDMDPAENFHDTLSEYSVTMIVDGEIGPGAKNSQMDETTVSNWGDGVTTNVKDSKIDEDEYTWGVADTTTVAVGPKGNFYEPGSCYGQSQGSGEINKNQRKVANSYVEEKNLNIEGEYYSDISGMLFSDQPDAHWVDPDTNKNSAVKAGTTCDLSGNDWGYGYNTGGGVNAN